VKYAVEHVEWFDQKALNTDNPSKGRFEDSVDTRKDENSLQSLLNDCKSLLQRKTSITQC
jgi:hypothetical protein